MVSRVRLPAASKASVVIAVAPPGRLRVIVREAMTPGVSLAKVALRHGLNANLLRKWVVKHGAMATRVATTPSLLPVVVAPSAKASRSARTTSHERTPIEIELPRGVVRFYGAIDRAVLRELIEALSLR